MAESEQVVSNRSHLKWQVVVVAMALFAVIAIVRSAPKLPPSNFNMIDYLDEQVGQKENRK